ncbi:MAG: zinc-dependent metalloprotease [bacterium]|nr:zinc-dependent metalloprotease [bacterium]
MKKNRLTAFIVLMICFCISIAAYAEDKTGGKGKTKGKEEVKEKEKKKSKFKEYSEVITKEAKTKKGVFTVHRIDDKVYYELSPKVYGKEFLWVANLSKTQTDYGYGGTPIANTVVRWERKNNMILLREIKYKLQAKEGTPMAVSVKASSLPAVIGSYDISCFAKNGDPVIDVTDLFVGDLPEFSPKRRLNAAGVDKKRSFINSVKAFPINIETRVLLTFKPKPPSPGPGSFFRRRGNDSSISVEVHHSMVLLPEKPMMPRFADSRIGYFGHSYEEYSNPDMQKVDEIRVAHRYRLEKKNPGARISEPVKPIVYYIGRGVPEKYKPYVKKAIDAWNVAFEQAGFKNAIIGKYAPSIKEDPDWDAEDARYSTIRWLPSIIQNASGPSVADPRSGEIIEADILVFHNVLKLARAWYFVQASPNDPNAQKLPFSNELMGKLLGFAISHEVGHTLGLRHNFKASSQMSVKQIRDPAYTAKHSYTPSIMDYARFNYIAQPGDGAALIPRIAGYDKFAIEWGYKTFPGVKSPEEERPFLNKIAARQLTDPLVRFGFGREGGVVGGGDHTAQTEDLSSNGMEATTLGLKNLERVMGYLVKATCKEGENYDQLKDMYGSVLSQLALEMGHVAQMVGSIEIHNKVHGMKGDFYTPIDASKQEAAVAFLHKHCFNIPGFFLKEDVVKRLGMHDVSTRVAGMQNRVLRSLLRSSRADRISNMEAAGYKTYSVYQLVGDLAAGIFSELSQTNSKIGVLRRNLQRSLVKMLSDNLTVKPAAAGRFNPFRMAGQTTNGDLKAASRYHLSQLAKKLENYSGGDLTSRAHAMDLYEQIGTALKAEKK